MCLTVFNQFKLHCKSLNQFAAGKMWRSVCFLKREYKFVSWINVITNYQIIPQNQRLFICDLHFDVNDIKLHAKKTVLRKNAVPAIKYDIYAQYYHVQFQLFF